MKEARLKFLNCLHRELGDFIMSVSRFVTAALERIAAAPMGTFHNKGKAGWYLAVRAKGESPEEQAKIDAEFKSRGYGSFKGAFTKLIANIEQVNAAKVELEQLGQLFGAQIDMNGLQTISGKFDQSQPQVGVQQTQAPAATDTTVPGGATPADQIHNMADKVRDDLQKTPRDQQADVIGKHISDYLDQLALEVDQAKQQDFIKSFLEFSSKFWKYSFVNQMLIWFQSRGKASNVAGYKKWDELGRQVQGGAKAIRIFAPMIKNTKNKDGEEEKRVTGFIIVNVFDFADTKPLDGTALAKWQANNPGKQPFEPAKQEWWMSGENEDTKKTIMLRDAAVDFASEKGVNVTLSEDTGEAGGYSAGGEISINYKSKGARQLSTIVHEIAHELIHWAARKDAERKGEVQGLKHIDIETDAESVAYVVMKHFGFDAGHAPNYLALSGGTSADVRKRRDIIAKAAKWIIEGMLKRLPEQQPEQGQQPPSAQAPETAMAWVQRNCKFAQGLFDSSTYLGVEPLEPIQDEETAENDNEMNLEQTALKFQQESQNFNKLFETMPDSMKADMVNSYNTFYEQAVNQFNEEFSRMQQQSAPGPFANSAKKP